MDQNRGIDWSLDSGLGDESSQLQFLLSGRGSGWQKCVAIACLSLAAASLMLVLMSGIFGGMDSWIRRSAFLAAGCIYVLLLYPLGRTGWSDKLNRYSIVDLILIIGVILSEAYIILNYKEIASPYTINSESFTWAGTFLIVAVLECTRRCLGPVVVLVPAFFIFHAVYGNYFPEVLRTPGVTWTQLIDIVVNIDTLFGIAIQIMVGVLGLFLLFGAILTETRVAAFFISLANSIAGHRIGGPAKVGVISSGFLATISGTAVGNVATTGTVTIPLMKSVGYSSEVAGGIEASASNGGHITPPVMGLVAFLIAGTIGMGYGELCLRALVPAGLYFMSIYLAVDLMAKRQKLTRLERDKLPLFTSVLKEGGVLLLPVLLIIIALALGYSATMSALVGAISAAMVSFFKKETRLNPLRILSIFEVFMKSAAPLIVACGMIGIILGALFTSGLGSSFASSVYDLAGGSVVPTLLAVAFASLVLGMGMPVVAVYIVLATLVIPALTSLGDIKPLQAHLFVFYYAVASGVTPPVCIVAFAAASIARADPMKTGYHGFMIGFAKHLIPLLFFFKASLLLYGAPLDIVKGIIFSALAVYCATVAIQRYVLRSTTWYETAILAFSVILLIPEHFGYNTAGALMASAVIIGQFVSTRRLGSLAKGRR